MNKADQEILDILKETFGPKKHPELILPDDALCELALKITLALSLLALLVWAILVVSGRELPFGTQQIVATPITVFFAFLFMHLNSKSKNPSIILFGLTWLSMTIALYFA